MRKIKGFTIRSISDDGTYYLCNHWNKNKSFWIKDCDITNDRLFTSPRYARSSLSKLLKVMPDYLGDDFTMMKIEEDEHWCVKFHEMYDLKVDYEHGIVEG